jgi:hypothetical protein
MSYCDRLRPPGSRLPLAVPASVAHVSARVTCLNASMPVPLRLRLRRFAGALSLARGRGPKRAASSCDKINRPGQFLGAAVTGSFKFFSQGGPGGPGGAFKPRTPTVAPQEAERGGARPGGSRPGRTAPNPILSRAASRSGRATLGAESGPFGCQ